MYSREYLQSLAQENKKNEVSLMISLFIDELKKAARCGATQYLVDFSNVKFDPYGTQGAVQKVQTIVYFKSLEEMIPMFQEHFPGCQVRVYEEWMDSTPISRNLKKGILFDWTA